MTPTVPAIMIEQGKLAAYYTIPMILNCPQCSARHIDEGAFAEVPHHTHACQGCGFVWRPAKVNTHGVAFLPGYRNDEPPDRLRQLELLKSCEQFGYTLTAEEQAEYAALRSGTP